MAVETYDILGFRIAIRAAPGPAREAAQLIFSGLATASPGTVAPSSEYELTSTPDGWIVRLDGMLVQAVTSLDEGLATLEWHAISSALARRLDLLHLHGAALRLPNTSAGLVLTGHSGCGKTTLSLGLIARGFTPFSDDASVVDPASLTLVPLRRAFHVDERTWTLLDAIAGGAARRPEGYPGYYVPEQWADSPAPVRWIVFPTFAAGARTELVQLTLAESVQTILAHTVSLQRAPGLALRTAVRLAQTAECYRLSGRELGPSIELLVKAVRAERSREVTAG
jgi:hypothetical protein